MSLFCTFAACCSAAAMLGCFHPAISEAMRTMGCNPGQKAVENGAYAVACSILALITA